MPIRLDTSYQSIRLPNLCAVKSAASKAHLQRPPPAREGYLTPADSEGWASFGASFVPNDADSELRSEDDRFNQTLMTQLIGHELSGQAGLSRASIRCASSRLPADGRCSAQRRDLMDGLSKL